MIYVTPDLKQIYTTNVNAATVSIWEKTPQELRPPPMRPGGQGGPPPGPPPPGMGGTSPPGMEPDGRFRWPGR